MKKQEWHSPQCKARSKTRFPLCYCGAIPAWRRRELDAEAEAEAEKVQK